MKKAKVVGAGFSGLVTAYYLTKKGFEVEVFEKEARPGGLIDTLASEWGPVETAANAFINSKLLEDLFSDLGLEMISTLPSARKRLIFREKPSRWPMTVVETLCFIKQLFVVKIKGRKLMRPTPEESVKTWGERILGRAPTNYFLGPVLQGIYAGDIESMNAGMVFKKFFAESPSKVKEKTQFKGSVTAINGMGSVIKALYKYLDNSGVRFHLSTKWDARLNNNDITVLTCGPHAAAEALQNYAPEAAESLRKIDLLPVISATVFYEKTKDQPQAFGCLFPQQEGFNSLGVLFQNCIFKNRGNFRNETWILGGAKHRELIHLSETEILNKIKADRERFMKKHEEPLGWKINFWPKALPHYTHEWAQKFKELQVKPPCYLIGNYMGTIGLGRILERASLLAEDLGA